MEKARPNELVPFGDAVPHGDGDRPVGRSPRSSPARPAHLPPSVLSAPPTPAALLGGLRRRAGVALVCPVLAVLAAVAAWYALPTPKFDARTLLHVSATPPKFVFDTPDTVLGDRRSEFRMYQQTQETLIKSRFVLNAALRNPDVAGLRSVLDQVDPVAWLAKEVSVEYTGEVLQISLKGNNPKDIIKLVNAVTDAFLNEVVNVERNQRLERYSKLKKLYADYQESLKSRRMTLKKLAEAAGSNDKETLAYKHQLAIERHARAERELEELRSELRRAKVELGLLGPADGSAAPAAEEPALEVSPAEVDAAIDQDLNAQKILSRIAKLKTTLRDHQRVIRDSNDPAMKRSRVELESLTAAMRAYREKMLAALIEQRRQGPVGPGTERQSLARRIKFLETYEKGLVAEVLKLDQGTQAFNLTALDLESTRDEIQHAEKAVQEIGEQAEALKVELEAPPRIRSLEKAEVPQPINAKKKLIAAGFTGFGALGMLLFSIAWWDTTGRRVSSVESVVHGLGMNLVGSLPARPARESRAGRDRGGRALALRKRDRSWERIMTESVDAVRTMILLARRTAPLRILMVASAAKGEGKTTLAFLLASSLARAGLRTLLVDCDLRRPAAHTMFDLPAGPGVCEALRDEVDAADVVQLTRFSGVTMIAAGRCDAAAIRALAQGKLQDVLDRVAGGADFIIVDSAPVLPVADSLLICQHVDAVLFSVLRDVSRLPELYAAFERIGKLGVRVLGAVVAGTSPGPDYGGAYEYELEGAGEPTGPARPVGAGGTR